MSERKGLYFSHLSYHTQPPPTISRAPHTIMAGILCQRCSSGTTLPHLFSCSFRLQGSWPQLWSPPPPSAPFPFVSVQCTLVINFVLLLFVPVTRSPLFWASSPWSTRLEVFFLCEPWQVPNWMMNVPLFLCNWTASSLIGLEDAPPPQLYPPPPPTPSPPPTHVHVEGPCLPEPQWMSAKPSHPSV